MTEQTQENTYTQPEMLDYYFKKIIRLDTNPGNQRTGNTRLVKRASQIIELKKRPDNLEGIIVRQYPGVQEFTPIYRVTMGLLQSGAKSRYFIQPLFARETQPLIEKAMKKVSKLPYGKDKIIQTPNRIELIHPNYQIVFRASASLDSPDKFYAQGDFFGWHMRDVYAFEDAMCFDEILNLVESKQQFCGKNNFVLYEIMKGLASGTNIHQFSSLTAAENDPYVIVQADHMRQLVAP